MNFFFYLQVTDINQFQTSVSFHMETIHLICSGNQMTGFYIKYNDGLKWVNIFYILTCKEK